MKAAATNVRLAALALSVVLFAAVWSGDRQHQHLLRQARLQKGRTAAAAQSAGPAIIPLVPSTQAAVPEWCNVPLPAALAPGDYRIVGTDGTVRSVQLTTDDLLYLGVEPTSRAADIPAARDGARRWYFIRLDDPAPERSVENALKHRGLPGLRHWVEPAGRSALTDGKPRSASRRRSRRAVHPHSPPAALISISLQLRPTFRILRTQVGHERRSDAR